jgi:hypothetical protein
MSQENVEVVLRSIQGFEQGEDEERARQDSNL